MSIADMNALPDISGNDSERLRGLVRVTTREVKAVGGASAGTTLEMIGYIRELEHALTNARAAVAGPRGDAATTARNRGVAQKVVISTESVLGERFDIATRHELADRITAALDAATSSPAPAEPSIADAIATVREMRRDWRQEEIRDEEGEPPWCYYVNAADYVIKALESLAPPESTQVAGEQETK